MHDTDQDEGLAMYVAPRARAAIAMTAVAVVLFGTQARSQNWTGLAAPNNQWTTLANWDTAVPGSGNTAVFNGAGNGNTSISLGGSAQPIGALQFIANPAAYTLGTLASGDKFNFDAGGSITVNNSVTTPQTINANIQASGSLIVTNDSAAALTLAGTITDAAGLTGSLQIPDTGIVRLTGTNTYSGITRFTGGGTIIPILVDSNGLPLNPNGTTGGPFNAGPFGKGQLVFDNLVSLRIRPTGANRMIANDLLLTSGFTMENNSGDSFNLTLEGRIKMTDDAVITNGLSSAQGTSSGTLYLGGSLNTTPITLPTSGNGQLTLEANSGPIVINKAIANSAFRAGSLKINPSPNPILFNAGSSYSGGTYLGTASAGPVVLIGTSGSVFGNGAVYPQVTAAPSSAALPTLMPHDFDRTVSNPIVMTGNFVAANEGNTSFNLNVNGSVLLTTADRTIINNMAGTLTLNNIMLGSVSTGRQLELRTDHADAKTIIGTAYDPPAGGAGSLKISNGTVEIVGGLFPFLAGPSTYSGGTFVAGGKLLVSGTDDTTTGTGPVIVSPGATLGGAGPVGGNIVNNGILDPGKTQNVGSVFRGKSNFTDGAGAQWNLTVGGSFDFNAHDYVEIAGNLDLTAVDTLNITRLPGTGSSWIIAGYDGQLIGTFDNITPGYTIDYGSGFGDLITVIANPVEGDYNNDGVVDPGDYLLWRKKNGTSFHLQNEVAGTTPGQVTPEDYHAWRARFGNPVSSGAGAVQAGSVPEPSVLYFFAAGIALVCTRRCE